MTDNWRQDYLNELNQLDTQFRSLVVGVGIIAAGIVIGCAAFLVFA